MILCTNNFDVDDESLSQADRKWLTGNGIIVKIPDEDTWYVKTGEQRKCYPPVQKE